MELKLTSFCFCFSLRLGCVLFGLLCSGCSLILFAESMSVILRYFNRHKTEYPVLATLDVISLLTNVYPICLALIFGLYLTYGAIKIKSHYCYTFLIGEGLYVMMYFSGLVEFYIKESYYLHTALIIEDLLITGTISLILYLIQYEEYREKKVV